MVAVGEVEPGSRKRDQRVDQAQWVPEKERRLTWGRGVWVRRRVETYRCGSRETTVCLYVHQSAIAVAVTRVRPVGGVAQQLSLPLSHPLFLSFSCQENLGPTSVRYGQPRHR